MLRNKAITKTTSISFVMIIILTVLSLVACAKPAPSPTLAPPKPTPSVTPTPASTPTPAPAPKPTPVPAPTPATPVIKVRWAGYNPIGHVQTVYSEKAVEAVRTRSQRQISVDWYPAEQLLKAAEIFAATAEGRLELGGIALSYIEGDIPIVQVAGLLGIWKGSNHMIATMEPLRETLQGEFAKKGVYLAGMVIAGGPQVAFSNRSIPYTPEDIKGLKIRVSGKTQTTFVELAGASAVFLTAGDIYTGLQRKTVDGMIIAASSIYRYKFQEVVKYASTLPLSATFFLTIANLKWWNGLPDNERKTIQGAVTEFAVNDLHKATFLEEDKVWGDLKKDMTVGEPTKEQAAAWSKVGDAANQQILKGLKLDIEAQKILDVIKKYER